MTFCMRTQSNFRVFSDTFAFAGAAISAYLRRSQRTVTQPQHFTLAVTTVIVTVCMANLKVVFHPTRGLSLSACTLPPLNESARCQKTR